MSKKIMVGLSGGVDSAVAAYMLKEQGYDVTCGFMRNWDSLTNGDILGNPTLDHEICTQEEDYNDAAKTAEALGLPLVRVDFIREYWQNVFQTFLDEYRKGSTPNPDILCNKYIKFDSFMKFARDQGFENVATGHYAAMTCENGQYYIEKAYDRNKDQTYFLAQISRDVLPHVVFPLGHTDKHEVRMIAEKLGLSIAKKKDSTGICFIGERDFRNFLANYLPMKAGNIININNNSIVGEHTGVLYYTIGQRKGLNIGGTGPYYVIGKDVEKNELYVTDEQNKQWLISDSCRVSGMNYLFDTDEEITCAAKFRYRQPDNPVVLKKINDTEVTVSYPQGISGVTPGQEAVFYLGDRMIGGGTIEQVYTGGEDLMQMIKAMRR